MSEEEIKQKFEKFSGKFEETIFTLITKFNEINDNLNRVQEALDYLEKIRIQTAENKQVMNNLDKSFKALEKRLREMSMDGFVIPAGMPIEEGIVDLLSAPATPSKAEVKDDLSDLGKIEELPIVEDINFNEELSFEPTPEPESIPEPIPEPISELTPAPAPPSEPILETTPESVPEPTLEPETIPEPLPESIPDPIHELTPTPPPPLPDLDITPPPKFEAAPELAEQAAPIASPPPVEGSLTPAPVPQSGVSVPAMMPNSNPGFMSSPLPPKPSEIAATQQVEESSPAKDEKIPDPKGPSDVWHNLEIDVMASVTNEDIALSLAQANDHLKRFVKFDKVLFKILKLAGGYRRKGTIGKPNDEEKADIIKEIGNWRIEFKVR
jgi:hypothetical protein